VRGPRRINAVLTGVRGFLAFAVDQGEARQEVMRQLYELADSRSCPGSGSRSLMLWSCDCVRSSVNASSASMPYTNISMPLACSRSAWRRVYSHASAEVRLLGCGVLVV